MKSQSAEYPIITRYDDNHIAVPVAVTEFTKENPMGGEPMTGFDFDLLIVPAADPVPDTITGKKQLLNAICQAIILDRFSLIHQIDVASGLYADKGMKAWIGAMVAESNRCADLIDINQVPVPAWPVYVEVI